MIKNYRLKTEALNFKEEIAAVEQAAPSLTPEQMKAKLKELSDRLAELEARYDKILKSKLSEAVGVSLSKYITRK